jgi:hypothetical protein
VIIRDAAPVRVYPVELRFAFPAELDLMARLAGLRLRERWRDWDRSPFTGEGKHVSVWELARDLFGRYCLAGLRAGPRAALQGIRAEASGDELQEAT